MRLQLFEWLDQAWLPAALRDGMRRYLAASYASTPLPDLWAEPLAALLHDTGETRIVDLGSGAAGPVRLVLDALAQTGCEATATLTDLYPMSIDTANDPRLRVCAAPVDARAVPATLAGVRTMFATFHHLPPPDAAGILRDAFEKRQAIAIFEATSRQPAAVLLSIVIPLLVLVMTPRVRPLTLSQLVFTYVIPLLPLLIFWDGFVSQLRTYMPADLGTITAGLQAADYHWDTGLLSARGVPFSVPYLIGRPRRTDSHPHSVRRSTAPAR